MMVGTASPPLSKLLGKPRSKHFPENDFFLSAERIQLCQYVSVLTLETSFHGKRGQQLVLRALWAPS